MRGEAGASWVLWGVELSPFALKVEAILRFHGLPHRWLPREGGFAESLRRRRWDALRPDDRARVEALLPPDHGLDRDGARA
jgi:hypothetical protein